MRIPCAGLIAGRIAPSILLVALSLSCGQGRSDSGRQRIELDAGKRVTIAIQAPAGALEDTVGADPEGSVTLLLPAARVRLTAFTDCCAGGTAAGRVADLASLDGVTGAEIDSLDSRDDHSGSFQVILYFRGDSCYAEMIRPRGCGEVAVLQARAEVDTPRVLLGAVQPLFEGAEISQWPGLRSVTLSDRAFADIAAEQAHQDVSAPPLIHHSLYLGIDPGAMSLSVLDSFSVDFAADPGLESVSFALPSIDPEATEEILALEGDFSRESNSIACSPDTAGGLFLGVYTSSFDGFYIEDRGFVRGQVRLSSSFCCGDWIYPGSDLPASYYVHATIPAGSSFYCPLVPLGSSQSGGRTLVSYASPEGGMISPLPWAAGNFQEASVASGRSRVLYPGDQAGQVSEDALIWADRLGSVLWDRLGFEGARLDFVLLEGLGAPVLSYGPGCLMISPEILASLSGHDQWADSLSAGLVTRSPRVVAMAARGMLLFSTYLPETTADALSAYSVYVFEKARGTEGSADSLLEACRLYYLSYCETEGGVEYSIADPMLPETPLAEPVLMGKAPIVFAMFSEEIPGFDYGLSRGLGSMRHSGNCYSRIASFAGLDDGYESDLYRDWLHTPGVPQIAAVWADSGGTLYVRIEQLQPGPALPLPPPSIGISYSRGVPAVDFLEGPDQDGFYTTPAYSWGGRILSIQLWPGMVLPADIIYERRASPGR
jgi:hypothetical protein